MLTWEYQVWQERNSHEILEDGLESRSSFSTEASNASEKLNLSDDSGGFGIVLRILTIIESLVTKEDNQYDGEAMESSEDPEVLTPVDLLNQKAGDERPQIRPDQEAECPEVDFASSLMKKEHVMNDCETDNLWCSVEETLECSTCCKSSVGWCLRCSDDNDTR